MSRSRVVVTGIGVISALGHTRDAFWESLRRGQSGIAPIRLVDPELLGFSNGAEVKDYQPSDHFGTKELRLLDRFSQFGLIAAREAVTDSGTAWSPSLRQRSAVVMGSCVGGQTTQDDEFQALYLEKKSRLNPLTVPRVMANAAASQISMEYGLTGPAYTVSSACSSASHAIGQAFWMVRDGLADMAVAGGSEAPFSLGHLKAWEAMRVVSTETCRPFSKDRRGMILGEGAGVLILETLQAARARKSTIWGEIVGFGMSADAGHLTQPSADGAGQAIRAALLDARLSGGQIGYINAHGTGTLANDPMETRAIRNAFGRHAERLAISSTKSMHGHALGAAGAIEAAATILALRHGLLPPTLHYNEPDPACDLDVVPNQARPSKCECALSLSFAFGGLNAVLAFRRWES